MDGLASSSEGTDRPCTGIHEPAKGCPETKPVVVHGETLELVVEQKSKAVWRAGGIYRGKLVQREGKRPNVPAVRWGGNMPEKTPLKSIAACRRRRPMDRNVSRTSDAP